MTPYYEQNGIVIYHGDCRDILPNLERGSIDCVLTDPPYLLPRVQFRPKMRTQTRTWGDFSSARMAFDGYLRQLYPLLCDEYEMFWFLDEVSYPVLYPSLYAQSYFVKLLVWNKERIGMGGKWRRQFELIIYLASAPNKIKSGRGDVLQFSPCKYKEHPFQKPLPLVLELLNTSSTHLILDPFMGSGTTLKAAKDLGRSAIGIEIEERYCELAAKRLCQDGLL